MKYIIKYIETKHEKLVLDTVKLLEQAKRQWFKISQDFILIKSCKNENLLLTFTRAKDEIYIKIHNILPFPLTLSQVILDMMTHLANIWIQSTYSKSFCGYLSIRYLFQILLLILSEFKRIILLNLLN